jgi:hypothetical protein
VRKDPAIDHPFPDLRRMQQTPSQSYQSAHLMKIIHLYEALSVIHRAF